jgi:superoxide dismutase
VSRSTERLETLSLANQDSVLLRGTQGLLCCDGWEDVYCLKYRNRRPDYRRASWGIAVWDVVDQRLREVMDERG